MKERKGVFEKLLGHMRRDITRMDMVSKISRNADSPS